MTEDIFAQAGFHREEEDGFPILVREMDDGFAVLTDAEGNFPTGGEAEWYWTNYDRDGGFLGTVTVAGAAALAQLVADANETTLHERLRALHETNVEAFEKEREAY